jgi:membrane-associated protein
VDIFVRLFTDIHGLILDMVNTAGWWSYLLLFVVIFCETGLVVTPFLPGDSLIFAAAAVAASSEQSVLNPWVLFAVLVAAAIVGDTVNYWIGAKLGPAVLTKPDSKIFRRDYIDRTHAFFERWGGVAIIVGRFAPFVRTFGPFLAGVGSMDYRRFLAYNVIGGVAWVALFTGAGYFFGRIPVVEKNLTLVLAGVVVLTLAPILWESVKRFGAQRSQRD